MTNRLHLKTVAFAICLLTAPAVSSGASVEDKIRNLQRQIDELRAQQQAQQRQVQEVKQASQAAGGAPTAAAGGPKVTFGGQYRVNGYTADNDSVSENDNQTAARLRLRQNVDIKFDEQFKTHVQFELQHTTDNVTTTDSRRGGKSTDVSVRHAVMDYTFRPDNVFNGTNAQVGIVPLQDYFHQTQFSADWDYSPLAVSFTVPAGSNSLRLFAANLEEGSESNADDDFVHYQADLTWTLNADTGITLTGTALNIADALGSNSSWHYNFGIGGHTRLGDVNINGFVMGSSTDKSLLGGTSDAGGVAALVELKGDLGPGEYGLLVSHASGEDDGTGFLMPMAFARSLGYWGYTGILTVQGATDTGFDGDAVNMSNNGYGMSSVQARYAFPVSEALSGYVAAGWYGNTDTVNRDSDVGTDVLVMWTYRFNPYFALDMGGAYARLQDSVSGYFQSVQRATGSSGAAFNQAPGEDRNKWALFTRVQAEF